MERGGAVVFHYEHRLTDHLLRKESWQDVVDAIAEDVGKLFRVTPDAGTYVIVLQHAIADDIERWEALLSDVSSEIAATEMSEISGAYKPRISVSNEMLWALMLKGADMEIMKKLNSWAAPDVAGKLDYVRPLPLIESRARWVLNPYVRVFVRRFLGKILMSPEFMQRIATEGQLKGREVCVLVDSVILSDATELKDADPSTSVIQIMLDSDGFRSSAYPKSQYTVEPYGIHFGRSALARVVAWTLAMAAVHGMRTAIATYTHLHTRDWSTIAALVTAGLELLAAHDKKTLSGPQSYATPRYLNDVINGAIPIAEVSMSTSAFLNISVAAALLSETATAPWKALLTLAKCVGFKWALPGTSKYAPYNIPSTMDIISPDVTVIKARSNKYIVRWNAEDKLRDAATHLKLPLYHIAAAKFMIYVARLYLSSLLTFIEAPIPAKHDVDPAALRLIMANMKSPELGRIIDDSVDAVLGRLVEFKF